MRLPVEFENRMKDYLGEEINDFLASYSLEEVKSLRINPLKCRDDNAIDMGFLHDNKNVPWEKRGFYYDANVLSPGKHPYHEAGAYYIQEASAMAPVTLLDVKPGDRVLDLCAAPGGKSTQIAGYLQGEGILISNEIVPSRAKILSENIERMGVRNAVVISEDPRNISGKFTGYFDKILVDAPCSGEGMFRRSEIALNEWSMDNIKMCKDRQSWILDEAYKMLAPGGRLVYSTCTFSKEEDEINALEFFERYDDISYVKADVEGLEPGFDGIGYRLWPHKIQGEGHYFCIFEKAGDSTVKNMPCFGYEKGVSLKEKNTLKEIYDFIDENIKSDYFKDKKLLKFGDHIYAIPDETPSLKGIKVFRPGLHIGSFVKGRFTPAHALFMALTEEECVRHCDVTVEDGLIYKYINGETFNVTEDMVGGALSNGYYGIFVDGYSIGFGKLTGCIMKNHYPKGLRKNLR